MQTYQATSQRIGKLKGELLAHAMHKEVMGITGQQKKMPGGGGDTIIYRRWLPFGASITDFNTINRPAAVAAAHILEEGVTPTPDTMTPQDVSVAMQQYGCLYEFSDKLVDLNEDDVPAQMKQQVGERMGLVREMIRYGILKAGTNAYYAGGSSRSTVAAAVTLNLLRKITRNLKSNHANMITQVLAPSTNFATTPVEAAWLVFCHSDCEADIRELPGFKHTAEYGTRKPVHDLEIGSCESFRFVMSPELAPYAHAGAAVGTTGLYSSNATNIDVYPMIVVAEDAWGQVALRGVNSIDPTYIPVGQKDKTDPLGQRGYAGAKFYQAAVILNQGWMAVAEVGITDLG
ncbi:MAG: N4-gp56 family major capsid protein [Gammaproteobacteria bacterium]|nr:N4-gp56 family major capsid protein [Gammaproteobacteria bacterium]